MVTVRVTGSEAVLRKLRQLQRLVPARADQAVEASAGVYLDDLKGDWLNRPGSGRVYGGHQASAPGEPPAPDTATYRNSWQQEKRGTAQQEVFTSDVRAPMLELGTVDMEARPHVGPSALAHRKKHADIVGSALKQAVREGAR